MLRSVLMLALLAIAAGVRGDARLRILEPLNNSTSSLLASQRLRLSFQFNQMAAASVKIDVMGFPDPEGWGDVHMMGQLLANAGTAMWSAELGGLQPGAARVRVRLLTADYREAVGDTSLTTFIEPKVATRPAPPRTIEVAPSTRAEP